MFLEIQTSIIHSDRGGLWEDARRANLRAAKNINQRFDLQCILTNANGIFCRNPTIDQVEIIENGLSA